MRLYSCHSSNYNSSSSRYLGVNISEKDKAGIIEFAKNTNPDIKIYKMKINSDKFKLDPQEIV